jgi:hypothetical protein
MPEMKLTLEQTIRSAATTLRDEDTARRVSSAEWSAIAKRLEQRIEDLGESEPVLLIALMSLKSILETVATGDVTFKDKIGAAKVILDLFKYLNPVASAPMSETRRKVTLDPTGRTAEELQFAAKYGCWPLAEDLAKLTLGPALRVLPDNRSEPQTGKVRE